MSLLFVTGFGVHGIYQRFVNWLVLMRKVTQF